MNNPDLYYDNNLQTEKDGILHVEEIKNTISWSKDEKLLDIGCGPGNFTAEVLLKLVPEDATVVGCDISKKMIDYANKKFKSSRLSFIELDIESNNIWDSCTKESYSKIYSLYCLHWVENTRLAIRNIYSLLKPGGEIFLNFVAEHKILNMFIDLRNIEPWRNLIKGKNYFTMYASGTVEDRKKRIKDELIETGFQEVQINVKECTLWYPSLDEYMRFVKSLDPWKTFIPKHLEQEYYACMEQLVSNNVVSMNPEDGKAKLTYSLFIIRGQKINS